MDFFNYSYLRTMERRATAEIVSNFTFQNGRLRVQRLTLTYSQSTCACVCTIFRRHRQEIDRSTWVNILKVSAIASKNISQDCIGKSGGEVLNNFFCTCKASPSLFRLTQQA